VKPFTTAIPFRASLAIVAWPMRQALIYRGPAVFFRVIVVLLVLGLAPHPNSWPRERSVFRNISPRQQSRRLGSEARHWAVDAWGRPGTASLPMIEGFLGLSVSGSYDIALTAVMPRSSRSPRSQPMCLLSVGPSEFLTQWEPILDGMREARLPKT
jgi:hypothetical protein